MIVEDAVQFGRLLFGELTAFPVELARIVHALTSSIRPASHVVESPLEGFPLFRSLRIDDWCLGKPMIRVDAKRNEPIANGVLLGGKAARVRLGQFHRVCL